MPNQIDLFNLIDENNITFYIVYLDENNALKRSEPLSATKATLYTQINNWCEAHKNNRFLYYRSNKEIMEA